MPRAWPTTLLAVALLGGCGDGAARAPQEVARAYVAGGDPAKCDDAALAFLERQTDRRGDAAREACRRAVARGRPPQEVRVTGQDAAGDRARVQLEADGQRVSVELERQDGRWLVAGFGD